MLNSVCRRRSKKSGRTFCGCGVWVRPRGLFNPMRKNEQDELASRFVRRIRMLPNSSVDPIAVPFEIATLDLGRAFHAPQG